MVEYPSYREVVPFPEEQVRPDTVSRRADCASDGNGPKFGTSPMNLPARASTALIAAGDHLP